MARLGDICEILNGFAFKSEQYVDSGVRIIRIANVQKGYIEDNSPVYYPAKSSEVQKYALYNNDLLMSLTGNVGRVALLEEKYLPAALNQRVACLRIKDGVKLSKKFLYHILNSDYFEEMCIASSKGVAQKNMSTEWLKEYSIPLPSVKKQSQIVNTLDKLGTLIFIRKQQLAKLDELIKARFVEMFGDHSQNIIKAESFMYEMRNGLSPSSSGKYHAKVLALSAVTQGSFDAGAWKDGYFDACPSDDKRICSSDFYMCRGNGNKALVGTGVYSMEDRPDLVFPDTVIAARVDEKIVRLPYLYTVWKTPNVRKQIEENARTTNGTYKINQKVISNIQVMVPPVSEQDRFAEFVQQSDKLKLTIQQSLGKLEVLRKSLMQEYFR